MTATQTVTQAAGVRQGPDSGAAQSVGSRLVLVIVATYAVMMAISLPQLIDPLVRHDDFPALLADPSGYYLKTLHEGRWINYLWHLREWVTPAWVNFAVYQLFWVIFAAATAVNACARDEKPIYVIGLALMIAVAPPALLISLWFNTLIPGLGLVALYAVLSVFLSVRMMRALLFVFVPLTLTAYTTYPLLLLAVHLTTFHAQRSFKDLFFGVALFTASFAFGIVVIYSLNYWEHGIFGIPMAEWRAATPSVDYASTMENLQRAVGFWGKTASSFAFHFTPLMIVHLVLFAGGLLVLGRRDIWGALYIVAGFMVGFGLLTLQVLATGVELPVRANGFIWVLYAVVLVRIVIRGRQQGGLWERIPRLLLMIIVASYLLQTVRQYADGMAWQSETRRMAQELEGTDGPIYFTGDYALITGAKAAGIQNARGLRIRLVYLTGREVIDCNASAQICNAAIGNELQNGAEIEQRESGVILRLPQ